MKISEQKLLKQTPEETITRYRRFTAVLRKDQSLRSLMHFVKAWDSELIKQSYGQFFYNIRHRLCVRDERFIIDDRVVIPTTLRGTVLESVQLTQQETDALQDIAEDIWFSHIHPEKVAS